LNKGSQSFDLFFWYFCHNYFISISLFSHICIFLYLCLNRTIRVSISQSKPIFYVVVDNLIVKNETVHTVMDGFTGFGVLDQFDSSAGFFESLLSSFCVILSSLL
jgi:hypothetical protein